MSYPPDRRKPSASVARKRFTKRATTEISTVISHIYQVNNIPLRADVRSSISRQASAIARELLAEISAGAIVFGAPKVPDGELLELVVSHTENLVDAGSLAPNREFMRRIADK